MLFASAGLASAAQPLSFTESTAQLLPGDGAAPFFSGVAIGVVDLDGDGKDDIVRFHRGRDLRTEYQTTPGNAFTTTPGQRFSNIRVAVAAADHDDNGKRDLVCGGYVGGTHLLTAGASGSAFSLTTLPDTAIVMQGMNFVDLDGDGDCDVFACDDIDDNHKYRNDGSGVFVLDNSLVDTAIAPQAGQLDPNAGNYASLWTDYDNDGDLDMYLSKCREGESRPAQLSRINRLFRNDGAGTFTDVADAAGLDSGAQTWCADFADIDNDGDLDAFLINHVIDAEDTPSALYENNGNGTFSDITTTAGISIPFFGVQAIFRDFNNDGLVDLLVSSTGGGYRTYLNDGDRTFTEQTSVFTTAQTGSGIPLPHIHSFAIGDLNSDGWPDVYAGRASGLNSPSFVNADRVYLNDGGTNHHLRVRLAGAGANPDGIGARLELSGAWDGKQTREVRSGEGYGVMHSLVQHFGLGAATQIDRLVVRWPSGTTDVIHNPGIDQVLGVAEGSSPDTFSNWRQAYFSAAELTDPNISGPNADPDGDRLENLLEWYFRTRPDSAASAPASTGRAVVEELAPGDSRLALTIDRERIPGVIETAEVSQDLINWSRGTPHVEVVSDTADQLVLRSLTDTSSAKFQAIRLVVSLP